MKKVGLIAGNRRFPIILAQAAKKKGFHIIAAAIKNDASRSLAKFVDKIYWFGLSELSRVFELFRKEAVVDVVMAGQISPRRLFSKELNNDEELKGMLKAMKDKRADSIFSAIVNKLESNGFQLLDSTLFLKDHMPAKGVLTNTEPESALRQDIEFGLKLAKAVADLDIGQTVAVREKAIVAVEALEGTDNLIRRAGRISRGGITVVKVSKPRQDFRFDVPVVGLNTIKNLIRAKARCLAIEAEKTLFIDQEESVALADKKGIAVVAV